jgi:hypothetical protein
MYICSTRNGHVIGCKFQQDDLHAQGILPPM